MSVSGSRARRSATMARASGRSVAPAVTMPNHDPSESTDEDASDAEARCTILSSSSGWAFGAPDDQDLPAGEKLAAQAVQRALQRHWVACDGRHDHADRGGFVPGDAGSIQLVELERTAALGRPGRDLLERMRADGPGEIVIRLRSPADQLREHGAAGRTRRAVIALDEQRRPEAPADRFDAEAEAAWPVRGADVEVGRAARHPAGP